MSANLVTAREVAEHLGVKSVETVLRWVRQGKLPAIRLPGGAIRFRQEDLDRWLMDRATPVSTITANAALRVPDLSPQTHEVEE